MHIITHSKSTYFVDKMHTCPHYDVDNFYGFVLCCLARRAAR